MFSKKNNELDFSCQSCGHCCRYFDINITHLDIERIRENRPELSALDFVDFIHTEEKEDDEGFVSTTGKMNIVLRKKQDKNECVFLAEDNRCGIHGFKPLVCRVWPFSLEKNKISWIKEHHGFIKKSCKHIFKKGANDPEELTAQLKQHYRERKELSRLIKQWNQEKKSSFSKDDIFSNLLHEDFLRYLLREIKPVVNYQEIPENSFLSFISKNLVKNFKEISLILFKPCLINKNYEKIADYTLNVFFDSPKNQDFLKENNLKKMALVLGADYFSSLSNNKISEVNFLVREKFIRLQIHYSSEINLKHSFDTVILYNASAQKINRYDFQEQFESELKQTYQNFCYKINFLKNLLKRKEEHAAKITFTSILQNEIWTLVFWLNQKNDLAENKLENKKQDLLSLIPEQIDFYSLKKLIDFFRKNWEDTEIEIEENILIKGFEPKD